MALLTPVSFNLGHGHAVYAGRGESVSHRVEPERLDDGHDDFHGIDPRSRFGLQLQVQGGSNSAFAARSAPHAVGLLRPRRERPSDRAAEPRDEFPSSHLHSITSSARPSSAAGISRPIAFAVLRLTTSSNLAGYWTGNSLGFAPR